MAVAVHVKLNGVSVEQYRTLGQRINEVLPDGPAGAVSHLCFGKDGALQIVDVWEDKAAFEMFMAVARPIAESLDLELPDPEYHAVVSRSDE